VHSLKQCITSSWWLTSSCYKEKSAKRIILSKPLRDRTASRRYPCCCIQKYIMTDPSCFLADLPYVSFLKHLVLICFLLKVKMKINGCVQNCHPNQRPPLDFFFSRAYSDISRSFDCCQKAPINEKPGKYPSYVVRRPLKVVLQ